jgi:Protein of unknown function (DUF1566)
MKSLSNELKAVISKRLEIASSREILAIASALCDDGVPIEPTAAPRPSGARFEVEGDVVSDRSTGLIWSRENVAGGSMKWAAAKEACAKLKLGGHDDWRLPTIRELLTLVDYERHAPAIDPVFKCDASYYWTSTPAASSPGACAWGVSFGNGSAGWYDRGYGYYVRAVRASQSFDLWHVR